jgi:hypothetical protein
LQHGTPGTNDPDPDRSFQINEENEEDLFDDPDQTNVAVNVNANAEAKKSLKRERKMVFDCDSEKLLLDLFKDKISQGIFQMKDVKKRLALNPKIDQKLKTILQNKGATYHKRIYDKIRNIYRKKIRLGEIIPVENAIETG